jgi:hypothetical protein
MAAEIVPSEADKLATIPRTERRTAGLVQKQLTTLLGWREREIEMLKQQKEALADLYSKAVAECLRRKQ